MLYEIRYSHRVKKELKNTPASQRKRIVSKIQGLAKSPRPIGCEKIRGSKSSYRIRVGTYRIIYSIYDQKLIVFVIKVGHRRDVYKKL
ncbi:type II toxin-antitoxin system RelE/ParE family toxin [Candidatus Saccharibacteria bacterium CPR2]|nr:type II toxin-antitoxin system RelE/ParE family toxin [Candidatus Saccharibacteria bacterium CPR2]